jgi:replication factor C subunit 1
VCSGKSTAAGVIARSLGFEVIEFNASDVRNKKSLEHVVGDITGNRGMTEFFSFGSAAATSNNSLSKPPSSKPSVIIMDEVDGMGGNEDRGGMQELVSLIKKTRTPMICIANDATIPKMKTLKNYCVCITWRRVPAAQIAPKIQEICRKEGLQIDRPSLEKLAESTQGDIRQILNFLQMFRKANKSVSFEDVKARIERSGKDFDLGPFDVVPGFFRPIPPAPAGKKNDWIGDRQNMYFVDSDIIPLFIQENYPHGRAVVHDLQGLKSNELLRSRTVQTTNPNGLQVMNDVLTMGQVSEAADSISLGDLLSDSMYSEQDYTLMPAHAVLSTIYPAYLMRGGMSDRIAFPQWLGKQSSRGKFMRIAREFKTALTMDIKADNNDIIMFILPTLRQQLLQALTNDDEEVNCNSGAIALTGSWTAVVQLC